MGAEAAEARAWARAVFRRHRGRRGRPQFGDPDRLRHHLRHRKPPHPSRSPARRPRRYYRFPSPGSSRWRRTRHLRPPEARNRRRTCRRRCRTRPAALSPRRSELTCHRVGVDDRTFRGSKKPRGRSRARAARAPHHRGGRGSDRRAPATLADVQASTTRLGTSGDGSGTSETPEMRAVFRDAAHPIVREETARGKATTSRNDGRARTREKIAPIVKTEYILAILVASSRLFDRI